ncbi:unnamed protein product [Adineta ricciae]|uniref:Uncharacterized protein n=1 Tax=Adineta ricciae TaxID=249248 RepID=A0A813Z7K3_ADIRI|nr:unnamed protein product [Adineta ricciae]
MSNKTWRERKKRTTLSVQFLFHVPLLATLSDDWLESYQDRERRWGIYRLSFSSGCQRRTTVSGSKIPPISDENLQDMSPEYCFHEISGKSWNRAVPDRIVEPGSVGDIESTLRNTLNIPDDAKFSIVYREQSSGRDVHIMGSGPMFRECLEENITKLDIRITSKTPVIAPTPSSGSNNDKANDPVQQWPDLMNGIDRRIQRWTNRSDNTLDKNINTSSEQLLETNSISCSSSSWFLGRAGRSYSYCFSTWPMHSSVLPLIFGPARLLPIPRTIVPGSSIPLSSRENPQDIYSIRAGNHEKILGIPLKEPVTVSD